MSMELYVFLEDARIPDRSQWQAEIDRLGFPIVLDPELNTRDNVGFVPATVSGNDSGFELYVDNTQEILAGESPDVVEKIANRDKCLSFRWGSDMTELCAIMAAAAALTTVADGLYYFPDDGSMQNAEETIKEARELLQSEGHDQVGHDQEHNVEPTP